MPAITISDMPFEVPAPYSEGHICSAAEASVLNSEYAENLRNNFARVIKARIEAGQELDRAALQQEFSKYAAAYQFKSRTQIRAVVDPITRAAHEIARSLVREHLASKGKKPSDLPEGNYESLIARAAQTSGVLAEAKRRVEATRNVTAQAMGLFDGEDSADKEAHL